MKVLEYDRPSYQMLATGNCYIFLFKVLPLLEQRTVQLGDGMEIIPGDRLVRLGGKKSSAGFSSIHMLPGSSLEYAGIFPDAEGEAMLFRQSGLFEPHVFYGGFIVSVDPLTLAFSTPARSSRLIETTACEKML